MEPSGSVWFWCFFFFFLFSSKGQDGTGKKEIVGIRVLMGEGIKVLATLLDVDPGALRMLKLEKGRVAQAL